MPNVSVRSNPAFERTTTRADSPLPVGDDLDIGGLAGLFRAHWPSVLAVVILTGVLGLLMALLKQPQYAASATISVADNPEVASPKKGKTPRADPRGGTRDVVLLRSHRLAEQVLRLLEPKRYPDGKAVPVGKVRHLLNRLDVSQTPGSPLITIRYRSTDPDRAVQVVDAVIDAFRQLKREEIGLLFATEKRYVDGELERRRKELAELERKIGDFKKSNGVADDAALLNQAREAGRLNAQLAVAQADAEKAQERWRQADALLRSGDMDALAVTVDSALVRRLREKAAELSSRLSEMRSEYGPRHPRLVEVENKRRELETEIERELRQRAKALKDQAAIEQRKVKALQRHIERFEQQLLQSQSGSAGLQEMELEAEALRDLFRSLWKQSRSLTDRARDLAVARSLTVVSPPYRPLAPLFPTRGQILALTAVAALLLGLLTAFVAEYFNPVTTEPRRARRDGIPGDGDGHGAGGIAANDEAVVHRASAGRRSSSGEPVVIPVPGDGTGIVPAAEVLKKPQSRFVAAIDRLRQRLWPAATATHPRVILVTALGKVGDKVSVAAALATRAAAAGKRVVVVDHSRGEAELHRAFSLPAAPGVAEVVAKRMSLTQALQTDFRSRVTLLARGEVMASSLAARQRQMMPSMLKVLREYFDLVIVVADNLDTGVAQALPDEQVDRVLVIAPTAHQRGSRPLADEPRLKAVGAPVMRVLVRH